MPVTHDAQALAAHLHPDRYHERHDGRRWIGRWRLDGRDYDTAAGALGHLIRQRGMTRSEAAAHLRLMARAAGDWRGAC